MKLQSNFILKISIYTVYCKVLERILFQFANHLISLSKVRLHG